MVRNNLQVGLNMQVRNLGTMRSEARTRLMLRRVAAIGDIHAESVSLELVLDYVSGQVEQIFAVGDVVDGLGDAARCCELLRGNNVEVVRGNHERWILNNEMRILRD